MGVWLGARARSEDSTVSSSTGDTVIKIKRGRQIVFAQFNLDSINTTAFYCLTDSSLSAKTAVLMMFT